MRRERNVYEQRTFEKACEADWRRWLAIHGHRVAGDARSWSAADARDERKKQRSAGSATDAQSPEKPKCHISIPHHASPVL